MADSAHDRIPFIVYISNRYKCQQSLIRINELKSELKDAKYRALSSGSELTQKTRESKVLDVLRESKDSTLHIPTQPPYIVNVKEEAQQLRTNRDKKQGKI